MSDKIILIDDIYSRKNTKQKTRGYSMIIRMQCNNEIADSNIAYQMFKERRKSGDRRQEMNYKADEKKNELSNNQYSLMNDRRKVRVDRRKICGDIEFCVKVTQ